MCSFIYVIMPLYLIKDGALWNYVTESQAIWTQTIILSSLVLLLGGLYHGSAVKVLRRTNETFDRAVLHKGAYILGALGLAAWFYVIQNSGGLMEVFGHAKGIGWSDLGYIREAAYLIIVALLLLMSPQGFAPTDKRWLIAVVVLSLPYIVQGLLGAQRGPTFLIVATLGMSWYLARGKRPAPVVMVGGATALALLLLLLVTNRNNIYLGSDQELKTDIGGMFEAGEANEYIFGIGCMVAADQTDRFFWGRRYLAQVIVRPIPRQIWPTKYEDFGVAEILQNAGVAGPGLAQIMGWEEIPGAAAAMVGDLWVEFSWFALPVMWGIGYWYGSTWRKAVILSGPCATQYMILVLLSIYMVSQSGEAVIFRLVILSAPTWYVWHKSKRPWQQRMRRLAG